jgi:tRNA threonylcarbamoyladenosine biosynthesis protein TsaB
VLLLALDTCDSRGSVALLADSRVLGEIPHRAVEEYSSWLLPAIDQLLSENHVSHSDLSGYAVSCGPGSFTGVRVGLTTAKAWAEVYSKPVFPVSRLTLLADRASKNVQYAATFIDAQRNQIFAALYRRESDRWKLVGDECVIDPLEFFKFTADTAGNAPLSWISLDPELLANSPFWHSRRSGDTSIVRVDPPLASAIGLHAFSQLLQQGTDALGLDANYVRRSDAEIFGKKAAGK